MTGASDLAQCREAIRHGSYSFHAASRLLPGKVRDPALALYAFCRIADDAVDLGGAQPTTVLHLRDRLDLIYQGRPLNEAADRAFARVVEDFAMPRALPDALLEGFAWDATGRRYRSLSDVRAYSARVAAAVGAMMTVLMGVRSRPALSRACDLGVAMQLTNIARDVGEDAREGRLYLPLDWLADAGIDVDAFLHRTGPDARIGDITRRLLAEADRLYVRAEPGIALLPAGVRPGIYAARHIYAAIGSVVRGNGYDNITRRARTGAGRKAGLLGLSIMRAALTTVAVKPATIYADPLPETQFLVDAAASPEPTTAWGTGRSGALMAVLAQLEAQDRAQSEPVAIRAT